MALKPLVEQAEKERELKRQEERERVKEKLADELQQNPPDVLLRQFREIEEYYKSAAKKFYPVEALQECVQKLGGFEKNIERYQSYRPRFSDIYSEALTRALDQLGRELSTFHQMMSPQWEQWQGVDRVLKVMEFRHRHKNDDARLVEIAKDFQQRAHGMHLDIPRSFFAAKGETFYVVLSEGHILGYFENYPGENRISFALSPPKGVNFLKLVRGVVQKFCREGPLPQRLESVNVRIYSRQEVKFYTDLGFMRTGTLGMSDWLYQKKL